MLQSRANQRFVLELGLGLVVSLSQQKSLGLDLGHKAEEFGLGLEISMPKTCEKMLYAFMYGKRN